MLRPETESQFMNLQKRLIFSGLQIQKQRFFQTNAWHFGILAFFSCTVD
jgi:hypothetical protein